MDSQPLNQPQSPPPVFLPVTDDQVAHRSPEREPAQDTEWFIRKTFETNPQKGCELLFKHYYNALCSHAVRFVYAKQLAEDLVGEVFYVFWQKQVYQQIHTSYRAYLFTAVRHRALTYLRWEFDRENSSEDLSNVFDLSSPAPSPDQVLQCDELYLKIEKAIAALTPQSQKVFLMNRFEGKKNPEIARELNLSLKTVEAHMTKALGMLRQVLSGEGLLMLAGLCGSGIL
jgi:RNA polymerase sigma-70 factor (family 1)